MPRGEKGEPPVGHQGVRRYKERKRALQLQLKMPNFWPEELMQTAQLKEFFFSPDCTVCGFIPQNLLKTSYRAAESKKSREVSPAAKLEGGSPRMPQLLKVLRNAQMKGS